MRRMSPVIQRLACARKIGTTLTIHQGPQQHSLRLSGGVAECCGRRLRCYIQRIEPLDFVGGVAVLEYGKVIGASATVGGGGEGFGVSSWPKLFCLGVLLPGGSAR